MPLQFVAQGPMLLPVGGGFEPETTAWETNVVGASGTVSPTAKTNINNLIVAIKGHLGLGLGTLTLKTAFDFLYMFVTTDNVIAQAQYDLANADTAATFSFTGTGTFSVGWARNNGWGGDGATNYLATTKTLGSGTVASRDSTHIMAYLQNSRTTNPSNETPIGSRGTGSETSYLPTDGTFGPFAQCVDNTGAGITISGHDARGLGIVSRTIGGSFDFYKNGAPAPGSPYSATSIAPAGYAAMLIGGLGGVGRYDTDKIAAASMGRGLTTTEMANVSTDINNYMIAAGASYNY